MKKNIIIIVLVLVSLYFVDTLIKPSDESKVEEEYVNNENEKDIKELGVKEYKDIFKESIKIAHSMDIENEELNSIVVKLIALRKIENDNKQIDKTELLEEARRNSNSLNAFLFVARNEYDINITDNDIENHIESEKINSYNDPILNGYAQALGITTRDLIYKKERNTIEREISIKKLLPLLKEKYKLTEDSVVLEKYNEEVNSYIAKNT
ncbi:hypothetical protein [Cytobacillus oceanisediminis]|uniref:hypothetical protein n=1 Tax=Cytobacillus oceanisediminis TaxID=665099 RepID=UPI00254A75EF|nr:hypothetical protein [Cytobacillus oceanisediminis]MDK7669175.1 hypothetical protein [Cytobacillus oceanisediminis]